MSLSLQEEAIMRAYYQSKVQDICEALEFNLAVLADAHFFLHHYFSRHSILDHDAKHVMLTCVFLATKCQNMHMTMDDFVKNIPNTQADVIVDLELTVLECVHFTPPSDSPVPCLYGAMMDYLTLTSCADEKEINDQMQQATDKLKTALLIDQIVLKYPPSTLALSCVPESKVYWEERLSKLLGEVEDVFQATQEINSLLAHYTPPDTAVVRQLDRRIKTALPAIN